MRAGLPGDQAVAVVPRSDLLTVGAVVLAVFAFVALAAVAFTYLMDPRGTTSTQTRIALMVLVGLGMAVPIYYAESHRAGTKLFAGLVVFALFVIGVGGRAPCCSCTPPRGALYCRLPGNETCGREHL
jgi:hypothetical protein